MRTCPACGLVQEHLHPYCKKCAAPLEPPATAASPAANTARVCPSCGLEQSHSYPFCKKCGTAMSGVPDAGTAPPPRCPLCGALKAPDWHICEHCGAGAVRPVPAARWLLWAGLGIFTVLWVAGLVAWWCFTYRVTLGPLVAGSAVQIDGKPVASFPHGAAEYSALLPRGQHALSVSAPGHVANEFAFRIGWSGLRRHFTVAQVPEVACVTLTGPQSPTVTAGATWPDHPVQNEFCAPVGTQAVAEWRLDATQPPVRQPFQYANDGDVIAAASGAPAVAPAPEPNAAPDQPAPNPAMARQGAERLAQACQALFASGEYRAALATCDQALSLDPRNEAAVALRTKIRKTMQVLGVGPADANTRGQRSVGTGLALGRRIAAANPDAELVSIDEDAGTIGLRNKKTGKVVTITFEDATKLLGKK